MGIIMKLELKQKTDNKGIIPPEGGWSERTWYVVDVKYFEHNPVHSALFFTGFLDNKNRPNGYNYLTAPSYDDCISISDCYYLKAVRKLDIDLDERNL